MSLQYIVQVPRGKRKYPSNYISTTKYNIITFLPFSLLLQFRRYANIYFLACAVLQSIPLISPLSPYSAILPLIFVLSLSMARQGYEDYKRWKSDKQNNSSITKIYQNPNWVTVPWQKLKPGDLVKVQEQQILAVDMIPFFSSSQSGISYVETSSLDGQKNLKPKISLTETQLLYNKNPANQLCNDIKCQINCEKSNADVNKFEGDIQLVMDGHKIKSPLNHKNLFLRGTKLKNTEWVIGMTVYTGKNTKIMQNGTNNKNKTSNIQRRVNNIILVILVFELFCCGCSALFNFLACTDFHEFQNLILQVPNSDCSQIAGIAFGSYFILYSTYIPISLIVSLEFVKVFQGYAMQKDQEMFSSINDRKMECHTVSINEQLGQIEYILTDKTGTLTCNKMQFKNIIIGNQVYGEDIKLPQIPIEFDYSQLSKRYTKNFNIVEEYFDSRGLDYDLSGSSENTQQSNLKRKQIELIFFMIATCHECLSQNDSYHGPSPDEVALLNAAKKIGFQFINTQNKITTVRYNEEDWQFEILKVIEFDSDRKRMTTVVKWKQSIMVFVKGADTSIAKLLKPNQKYYNFVNEKTKEMARTGLRSLWFAYKSLPIDTKIQGMNVEEIQGSLNLLGATGIQDRLQDFVPQTIHSLRQGNIKFIMLTGDKLQTAQNIARSCKMISSGYLIDEPEKLKSGIQHIKDSKNLTNEDVCPVIDGSTIDFAQEEQTLLQIIELSVSAVFCRVTPSQKAKIVKIVKKLGKLTLAIGDGANDVNMILQAHVGIGIFGEEGMRAAQVSNYAIGEFCLIWKLLLYYGRLNYMRISEMILYFFYKNMVFTIVQFAYCFYNLGSGQSFWLSWSITFYNMVFTFFPVVLRAVFQVDVEIQSNKKTLRQISEGGMVDRTLYSYYPKMYIVSQKNQLFTNFIFFTWFFLGVLQGVICLMITLYSLGGPDDTSGTSSYESGFYFAQLSAYTSVIIVVTMKLAINVKNWNCLLLISFIVPSLGAYVLYCFLSNYIDISVVQYYFTEILTMPTFYIANILAILGMFSVDLLLFSVEATKSNFQNYFKFKALTGKRMTEANLANLMIELEQSRVH